MKADRQLAIVADDRERAQEIERSRSWSDVEGRIVKHALGSGVRRVTDLAIRVDEWQDARARLVWSAALRMIEAGKRTVWIGGGLESEIAKSEPIETARDCIAWIKAAGEEHDADDVNELVSQVRDRNYCARARTLAARMMEAVNGGSAQAAERGASVVAELRDLTETRQRPSGSADLVPVLEAFDGWVEDAKAERATVAKMPSLGIPTLDRYTRRYPGKVTMVAAESHVGKTGVIAGAILASARAGVPAAFVSTEDTWREIVARMAAELGRFNTTDVSDVQPKLDINERLASARLALVGVPIWGMTVDDRKVDTVVAMIRLAASKGCRVVAVDHFHAIRRPSWCARNMDRREWQDAVLDEILATFAQCNVHGVIGSQVTRDKTRKTIGINDLRESSKLGEAAQNVIGLSRIESKDGSKRVLATIAKAKGTSGEGRTVRLTRDAYGTLVEESSGDDAKGDEWGA